MTGTSDTGDHDGVMVVFFEVPDTTTSTLYFAVNDPGYDGIYPDEGTTGNTGYYLVGGAGAISDGNSRLVHYPSKTLARTGNVLSSFTGLGGALEYNGSNEYWVYFPGVSPSQGEHIGNKYYFKIVADADRRYRKKLLPGERLLQQHGIRDGGSGCSCFLLLLDPDSQLYSPI